jgi:hypothetical protein
MKKPKLTKAEQARVDQIKKAKGPVLYKGELSKHIQPKRPARQRVTVNDIFNNPKGWLK